jgi:hypothetical protein
VQSIHIVNKKNDLISEKIPLSAVDSNRIIIENGDYSKQKNHRFLAYYLTFRRFKPARIIDQIRCIGIIWSVF